jgi:hypothetical protein
MVDKIQNDTDIEVVIQQEPNSPNTTSTSKVATQGHKSWAWMHFKVLNEKKVQCEVKVKTPNKEQTDCGKELTRDRTGSTKSMLEHLRRLQGG